MILKLKPKSEFNQNILTLMTGTTIAQAIPIAVSPILTRIYTPEDFGIFALFLAICLILGTISNARYEQAIMLPKKDEDAIYIVALGFIITCIISIILLIIIVFMKEFFVVWLGNKDIGFWLYLIPITVFFIGLFNILNYFNNRKKNYKDLANATILKSITMVSIQLIIGFVKEGAVGLITGQVIANMAANIRLFKSVFKEKVDIFKISKVKILALAKRYKNFPKYSVPAIFANSLSQHLVTILISTFYNISTVGFYSLVQKVLGIPSSIIGTSIGQVLFQEATKEKQKTGYAIKSFNSTVKKLFFIGIIFFGIIFFLIEDLFAFVFGEEWRVAGVYAQILLPLFFVRFISSTMSVMLTVFEKQKNELYINLCLIALSIITISIFDDFYVFLSFFTLCMSIGYILLLVYYYKLSKGSM